MKKIVTFTIIAILAFSSKIYSNELLGFYITKPEIFPGFHKPYSEPVKKAIERMTWKMQITDKNIFIWIKKNSDPLVIPYIKDGKYLLGTNQETEIKLFMPFYVENNYTIHGNNTVFYKTNE